MKGSSIAAALALAVAWLALGSNSASADHCRSGGYGHGSYHGGYYGTGYYGSGYHGGFHAAPAYRSFYQPHYQSYGPSYRGGYYGHGHYRSGYSYGTGFGTRSHLWNPGLIGG
jgi:hypothetical protein